MSNMSMQTLSPILMVSNFQKSLDYYQNILHFNVLMKFPENDQAVWALLQNDNITVMLQDKDSLAGEYLHLANRSIGGTMTLYIKMTNLDAFYNDINSKVKVIKAPHISPYQMKEFAIEDLDGYLLVFAEEAKK